MATSTTRCMTADFALLLLPPSKKASTFLQPVMLLHHGQRVATDADDRLLIKTQGCFSSTIELVPNTLNPVCHLTGVRLQR